MGNRYMGSGQSYQEGVILGQRYGFMTNDAFDRVATAAPKAVGPRPISIVSGGHMYDEADDGSGATGNPFSPTESPVIWIVGLLAVGLVWLHFVHF
jgi:hypothetical protein